MGQIDNKNKYIIVSDAGECFENLQNKAGERD